MKFTELKEEILKRAKNADACTSQYQRAYKSENPNQLIEVIKDNFNWAFGNGVIDGDLIDKYEDMFAENDVWYNKSICRGYLLASDNATVKASDNATVEASDNATVEAWGNATVKASGNATVRAWGNATVEASGNATVEAWGNATVEASGNATVEASGNATVEASGNAYINCHSTIECKISERAIVRRWNTNTIQYVDNDLKFEKLQTE